MCSCCKRGWNLKRKMEDSGEQSECSRTSGKNRNEEEEDKNDGGSSSSNSTVEESEKTKSSVRPYVRSKMPRLRWTPDLHLRFIHAVERLGGQDRATPKLVLQMMNIKGLNIAHVKSHLQMYRSKKMDDQTQGTGHQRLFMEGGGDQNVYNLSQLPMLPTFQQRLYSTFRYEEANSWNCHGNWMQSGTIDRTRRVFYTTLNQDLCTRIPSFLNTFQTKQVKNEMGLKQNPSGELTPLLNNIAEKAQERAMNPLKRKVSSDSEVDLNLSLGVKPRNEDNEEDNENGSSCLSLSLSWSRFKEDTTTENGRRGASTLDLTL